MIYLELFISFLKIGAFSFGGGYAAMPLIQEQVVNSHQWLSLNEFTDLITISQMTPGPIAINSATFVGTKVAGVLGALVATLGCILPSCILVSLIAYFYIKYKNIQLLQSILKSLRPAVVAMIATAGLSIIITAFFGTNFNIQFNAILLFSIAVYLMKFKKAGAIQVMVMCGVLNMFWVGVQTFI